MKDLKTAGDGRPARIKTLELNSFMLFKEEIFHWSPDINIIMGDNNSGKTTLLKALYCLAKPVTAEGITGLNKEQQNEVFASKLAGVFRPDDGKIGRLVTRHQGSSQCGLKLVFTNRDSVQMNFGSHAVRRVNLGLDLSGLRPSDIPAVVYIPPKEMISATEHFRSLYENYHLDFEETYYDLTDLLDRPLKRGANSKAQNQVLQSFESLMNGTIRQKDHKFFLNISGEGEFEMGLLSEGYRKISTLIYLVMSGSLGPDAILFWDEPETNMNPKMIRPLADAMLALCRAGVQIFITTHDYFLIQQFNLASVYKDRTEDSVNFRFVSF